MAQIGRPKAKLIVSEVEHEALERLARRRRTNRQLAFRARIILRGASGLSNTEVARELRCAGATVGKWRQRFVERRLDGLQEEPRPGVGRTITDEKVEDVVVRTLETTPRGSTHWSTRSMAERVGLSHSTISRIWRTFGSKPHRTKSFQISDDRYLVEKCPVTSSASTCHRRTTRSIYQSTRSRRFRRWLARHRSCRWMWEVPSDAPTTTSDTEQRTSSRHSTLPPAKCLDVVLAATDRASSCTFSRTSTRLSRRVSRFTSFSTISPPTRRPP